jgi:hypothetical protein
MVSPSVRPVEGEIVISWAGFVVVVVGATGAAVVEVVPDGADVVVVDFVLLLHAANATTAVSIMPATCSFLFMCHSSLLLALLDMSSSLAIRRIPQLACHLEATPS